MHDHNHEHHHDSHDHHPHIPLRWRVGIIAGNLVLGAMELGYGGNGNTADGVHNIGEIVTWDIHTKNLRSGADEADPAHIRKRQIAFGMIAASSLGSAILAGLDVQDKNINNEKIAIAASSLAFNTGVAAKMIQVRRNERKQGKQSGSVRDALKHAAYDFLSSGTVLAADVVQRKMGGSADNIAGGLVGVAGAVWFRPTKKNVLHSH